MPKVNMDGKMSKKMENTQRERTEGVSNRLRLLREAAGMTQGEFADALGVSRGHISNIESGKAEPSLSLLWNVERKFHLLPDSSMGVILFGDRVGAMEFNTGAIHKVGTVDMRALTCAVKRADEMERQEPQPVSPHIKAHLIRDFMVAYVERYQQMKVQGAGTPDDWHAAAVAEVDGAGRFPAE